MKHGLTIKGAIFDMDGVLVDSEKLYQRFWIQACADYGFVLTEEQSLSLRSNSPEVAIPKFKAWFGEDVNYNQLRDRRRKLMSEYIDANGVELKSGAEEIIEYLKSQDIKIALATASPLKRAEHYLSPYGLMEKFDAVVCGSMVEHGKPAPDIYLCAAKALDLNPCECIAVEDSPTGVRSSSAAGCVCVFVPDLTPPEEQISSLVYYIVKDLDEIRKIV